MSNVKSNFNDVTGATIITSTKNQDVFEANYQKILDGTALAEAESKQTVTMFPVTIKIPQQLHRELSALAEVSHKSVERVCQEIFLQACAEE